MFDGKLSASVQRCGDPDSDAESFVTFLHLRKGFSLADKNGAEYADKLHHPFHFLCKAMASEPDYWPIIKKIYAFFLFFIAM